MSNRAPRRNAGPRAALPTAPSSLFIGDSEEAAAFEPLLKAARLKTTWRLIDQNDFDLEEFLLGLEEEFEGPLRLVNLVIIAADRLVDARLDLINLLDELLEPRKPIVVSCTQATVTEQAMLCQHPERLVGVGILGLLAGSQVAEVAASLRTEKRFIDQTLAFLEDAHVVSRLVSDSPGMVIGRLLAPVVNEAAMTLSETNLSAAEIDKLATTSGRFPVGPLQWADRVGLDRVLMVLEFMMRSLDTERYRPAPVLRELALSGMTGEAVGRGFFSYEPARSPAK